MSLRDGDLVVCWACGRLSFYRGYQTCPHHGGRTEVQRVSGAAGDRGG